MPILMSDPSDLTIPSPENLSVPNISAVIDDIHIQRLGSIKKTGQYQMNSDPHRTHLYELLVLLSDLSLVRSLMYSQCDQSAKTIVPVPKLSKGPIEPLQGLDGSFVVPNGVPDNSLDGADDMTLRREGMDRFVTARLQAREASAPRQTFDMRQVYEQLISDLDVREERVPVGPFSLLEGVRRLLTETDEVIHPATSL
jgi:hypothetical protein